MKDLGTRVGVAAVGIPTVLAAAWLGGWFLAVPLAAFAAWGAHEIYRMAEKGGVHALEPVGVLLAAALVLAASARPTFADYAPLATALLALATLAVLVESMRARGPGGGPLAAAAVTLFGGAYLGLSLAFAPLLEGLAGTAALPGAIDDRWTALLVIALPLAVTWIGDAAAYFAGTAWGKGRARLAPTISPNKSWVGFWAALAGGAVAAWLWSLIAGPRLSLTLAAPVALAGGAVLASAAVVGDLVESLLKREAGVKDSGTFFPGHGGVLDRVDSLLFTIPTAYVLLALAGSLS